ncbi:hypothetical protein Y1Q_0010207 [Alligator mississippiensis]|uniref:Uncharacterized protein n=1 Tax=Alligator mississippiensis TaxID=8496 RepID=A0A151NGY4_ALLMI|nr:hypothetical protein Y1Q_0010207 [Alligator mississippiensis]
MMWHHPGQSPNLCISWGVPKEGQLNDCCSPRGNLRVQHLSIHPTAGWVEAQLVPPKRLQRLLFHTTYFLF